MLARSIELAGARQGHDPLASILTQGCLMRTFTFFRRGVFVMSLVSTMWGMASPASAADLAFKAPPPPPATGLDIHGFFDAGVATDFMTARGLYLIRNKPVTGIDMGLIADLYKNKGGFINKVSIYAGTYFQLSNGYHPLPAGVTNSTFSEFDWWAGGTVSFAHNWAFDAQYYEIISPQSLWFNQRNLQLTLSYDDTSWGLPVQFKPYVLGWYQLDGTPNVGGTNKNGYIQFGSNLTWDLTSTYGVKFIAPTYVSVGPKDYWKSTGCGTVATAPCAASNGGVFSTGLTAVVPVTWVPKNYGNWAIKGGFQYYHLINDGLLAAQVAFGGPGTGVVPTYADAKRDIAVGFVGIGFTF